jgi:hypothetical protein
VAAQNTSEVRRAALRIASVEPVGWEGVSGRTPGVGEQVYCLEGPGEVVKVLGRVSDGSRLLEIRLPDRKPPFFAASSNVLVRPEHTGD